MNESKRKNKNITNDKINQIQQQTRKGNKSDQNLYIKRATASFGPIIQ